MSVRGLRRRALRAAHPQARRRRRRRQTERSQFGGSLCRSHFVERSSLYRNLSLRSLVRSLQTIWQPAHATSFRKFMNSLETAFTKSLGCRLPIIAGPMFLVSDVDLVVAASEA